MFGRADPEWGQRVVALVVPADTASPPTLAALRAWVTQRLPAFAAPKEIITARAVPRTSSGKIRRHALARRGDNPVDKR